MDNDTQNVRETTIKSGNTVDKTTEVSNTGSPTQHRINIAERVVWFMAGIIEAILAIRFVLVLLGANAANAFADFIYSVSRVFISPFFSLFSYDDYVNGVSRVESYTIVAMIVYLLIAAGVAKLVTLTRK